MSIAPRMPELPDDLKPLGWQYERSESDELRRAGGTKYKVVYVREFTDGVDDERVVARRNDGRVVVSTRSESWERAFTDAVAGMRYYDSLRNHKSN